MDGSISLRTVATQDTGRRIEESRVGESTTHIFGLTSRRNSRLDIPIVVETALGGIVLKSQIVAGGGYDQGRSTWPPVGVAIGDFILA